MGLNYISALLYSKTAKSKAAPQVLMRVRTSDALRNINLEASDEDTMQFGASSLFSIRPLFTTAVK